MEELEQTTQTQPEEQTPEVQEESRSLAHWQRVEGIYEAYLHQAESLGELFPDFDVRREMQEPIFARMVGCGLSLEDAFLAAHGREILPAAMAYAARYARERCAASLAGGTRPGENGTIATGPVQLPSSVATMSQETFRDLCHRVSQGEKLSFG